MEKIYGNILKIIVFCLVGFVYLSPNVALGQIKSFEDSLLVRGPYLQAGRPDGMTIQWRTAKECDAWLSIWEDGSDLKHYFTKLDSTTEHVFVVNDLKPFTKYYYQIGNVGDTLGFGGPSCYFVTSPIKGTIQPIRIWAIGDAGRTSDEQRMVKNAYNTYRQDSHTDIMLLLGDNAYDEGTDQEYQYSMFENMFDVELRNRVLWPSPGNHDLRNYVGTSQVAPYYDIFNPPTQGESGGYPSGSEAFYSYDYGNVHMISLDSYGTSRLPEGEMSKWLEKDLSLNKSDWVIAYWHHPPYTKGTHDSDTLVGTDIMCGEMREMILPILEKYGVDLILTGHSHSYERSYMIHGHYGYSNTFDPSVHYVNGRMSGKASMGEGYVKNPVDALYPNVGCVYSVMGCSGNVSGGAIWQQQPSNKITTQLMYTYSFDRMGSIAIDIHKDTLKYVFVTKEGVEDDNFVIIKDSTKKISLGDGIYTSSKNLGLGSEDDIQVWPNPFKDAFDVKFRIPRQGDVQLNVSDLSGRVLYNMYTGALTSGKLEHMPNLEELQPGIYLLNIKTESQQISKRLVKNR